jgi:hypothetical protein
MANGQVAEQSFIPTGDFPMADYSPELIQIMRAALDDVMTKVPIDHATVAIKARMAELILKRGRRPHKL